MTDFLEREAFTTPVNYHKLRFLGNHDTVSWVWQSRRAVDCYGVGGAKALWAVISFIDGMPMIYQGDEDPTLYLSEGENLTKFFTKLFADRKKYIPKDNNETIYLHTGTPVMAFLRGNGKERRLFAINLSDKEQTIDLSNYKEAHPLLAKENSNVIKPYDYQIFAV